VKNILVIPVLFLQVAWERWGTVSLWALFVLLTLNFILHLFVVIDNAWGI
jgi:hypothetical protein